jgi:uncharacterized protein (TIGR02118 family)
MMKSICALARRADLRRDDFVAYYEDRHAPLALRYFPFRRYVRNHLLNSPEIGFDTITEFWADDLAAMTGLMDGPVGEIMSQDERCFMDQSRIAPGSAEEHVLSEGSKTDAGGCRDAALINWQGDEATGRNAILAWGGEIAQSQPGVSVDFVESWSMPRFPARAVLWAPGTISPAPPLLEVHVLRVRRIESEQAELLSER